MRLLIVEDHDELAELVIPRLARAGLAADRVGCLEDARLALNAAAYDAMVLDLGLPDGNGLELLRWLRGREDELPVLILTARSAVEDRVDGLKAGADDYLAKPFAAEELVARIEALLRRASVGHAATWTCGKLAWDPRSKTARVDETYLSLTARETQLLAMLLRDRDKVVRKSAIEASFFGLDEEFSSNAIEVSVHRLRKRLEAAGARVEIVTVRGLGYLLQAASS